MTALMEASRRRVGALAFRRRARSVVRAAVTVDCARWVSDDQGVRSPVAKPGAPRRHLEADARDGVFTCDPRARQERAGRRSRRHQRNGGDGPTMLALSGNGAKPRRPRELATGHRRRRAGVNVSWTARRGRIPYGVSNVVHGVGAAFASRNAATFRDSESRFPANTNVLSRSGKRASGRRCYGRRRARTRGCREPEQARDPRTARVRGRRSGPPCRTPTS